MKKIFIFDTTLRDGEQSPGAKLNINEKLTIAKQLEKLGVDIIEAGFPIASNDEFEAVKLISKEIKKSTVCALSRALKKDIVRAGEALKYKKNTRLHTFIATSQVHIKDKLRKSQDEVIKMVKESVRLAKSFCNDVEFSPEDASRTDINYSIKVIKEAILAGATTINIPDTVGYAQPAEFGKMINDVINELKPLINKHNVLISVHCHNDLGLAVANSLAGIQNGASQIECTMNGIGERAGNCSLEEVVMNLKVRKDFFKNYYTGVNTKEIYKTSRLVSRLTGLDVQKNKAIVGANAFAHEAGIHQQGVIANRNTYEIMSLEDVGWQGINLVIGKHSGKASVGKLLKDMKFNLSDQQIEEITSKIKSLADRKKEVLSEDIIALAEDVSNQLTEKEKKVKIDEISIITGNKITPTATVKLNVDGETKVGASTGVGPVDALGKVIQQVVDPSLKLVEYSLKAITGGTNALADVSATIEDKNGLTFRSHAINEDIVIASANAIVKAINKALIASSEK